MKILLTGGGTGGHITPILAVAHELKLLQPSCKVIYVGERGSKFAELTANHSAIDEIRLVYAGKFRRYHGESWIRRLTDIKTILLNLRDAMWAIMGTIQAWFLLGKIKPDVVFLKGGFVGVPIGLASALRHIPIVTHDSDAVPGLANRLVSRWAIIHATALPAENYPYKSQNVRHVGVLVEPSYKEVTPQLQHDYKVSLEIPPTAPLLLVTGGSSGAESINEAIVKIIGELLQKSEKLYVIHQVGRGKSEVYGDFRHDRLKIVELLKPMSTYTGAADLVITRAGANTLAELGVQGKACIVIASPHLTGGHQLKNAKRLEEQGTAVVISEDMLINTQQGLLPTVLDLLTDDSKRLNLGEKLRRSTITDAAHKLAKLLLGANN